MNTNTQNITSAHEITPLSLLLDRTKKPAKPTGTPLGTATTDYAKDFWHWVRTNQPSNALAANAPTSGGVTVSDEFENRLIEAMSEENVIRRLAHVMTTESGSYIIPLVVAEGSAEWVLEESVIPESDPSFDRVYLTAHKLGRIVKISSELLHDSAFDLEDYIIHEFARSFGRAEEEAFIGGDGEHRPYGMLHPTRGAKIGVEMGSTAITPDALLDLVHSVPNKYRSNGLFLMSDDALRQIKKIKDANGEYLWDVYDLKRKDQMLLGYPLVVCDALPAPAAGACPILFGDFTQYMIADRQQTHIVRLDELYTETDMVGFKATRRVDGLLMNRDAVKALKIAD